MNLHLGKNGIILSRQINLQWLHFQYSSPFLIILNPWSNTQLTFPFVFLGLMPRVIVEKLPPIIDGMSSSSCNIACCPARALILGESSSEHGSSASSSLPSIFICRARSKGPASEPNWIEGVGDNGGCDVIRRAKLKLAWESLYY